MGSANSGEAQNQEKGPVIPSPASPNYWTFIVATSRKKDTGLLFGKSGISTVLYWEPDQTELVKTAITRVTGTFMERNLLNSTEQPSSADFPVGGSEIDEKNGIIYYYSSQPDDFDKSVGLSCLNVILGIILNPSITWYMHNSIENISDLTNFCIGPIKRSSYLDTEVVPVPEWVTKSAELRNYGNINKSSGLLQTAAKVGALGVFGGLGAYALGRKFHVREKLVGPEERKSYEKYKNLLRSQGRFQNIYRTFRKLPYSPQALRSLMSKLLEELDDTGYALGISDDGSSVVRKNKVEDHLPSGPTADEEAAADEDVISLD